MRIEALALTAFTVCVWMVVPARGEYAVRDGDTVVFLGDSITAARQYSKVIEQYTFLRFPERKVRFVNAGRGGETARQVLDRLDDAVFGNGATLVTVAYGVNDIGWGTKADAKHRQQFLDAVGQIIDRCRARGVRVFICSAAITAEDPEKAAKGFLQEMCDAGLAVARSKDAGAIDVQRSMREVQRRMLGANASRPKDTPATMHAPDGVHLNDLGQMAMAWAILKGLGAPADVSSATVDASGATLVNATDCEVTALQKLEGGDGLRFTRTDARLPLNLAPLWMLHGMYIPISEDLNRYMLSVRNLPTGRYAITAGGRALGQWDAGELARGVNLASATADPWVPGGPWDGQAHALKVFTDMRDELAAARRGMDANLAAHPRLAELRGRADAIEQQIVELQCETAKPVPVEFVIRRLPADDKAVQQAGKK